MSAIGTTRKERSLPTWSVVSTRDNRGLAKNFENLAETLATFVALASIQPALGRLARAEPAPRNPP